MSNVSHKITLFKEVTFWRGSLVPELTVFFLSDGKQQQQQQIYFRYGGPSGTGRLYAGQETGRYRGHQVLL